MGREKEGKEKMRASEKLLIFVVCLAFSFYLFSQIGLGGSEFQELQFWNSLQGWTVVGFLTFVGLVITALTLTGTSVQGLTFGGTVGSRIADAAELVLFGGIYAFLVGYVSYTFYSMPYIGVFIGPFFAIIAFLIYIYDVRKTVSG